MYTSISSELIVPIFVVVEINTTSIEAKINESVILFWSWFVLGCLVGRLVGQKGLQIMIKPNVFVVNNFYNFIITVNLI